MIPEFDSNGNLPPGIWDATILEVEQRFATNMQRQTLFNAFSAVVEILRDANCPRVFLDGSFICDVDVPNDYDMVYEWQGLLPTDAFHALLASTHDERKQNHLGDIFIRMAVPPFIDDFVDFWQTDRDGEVKGIIRIDLLNGEADD